MSEFTNNPSMSDPLPPINGEVIPPKEAVATAAVLRVVEKKTRDAAADGPARRDAHPKGHGCVMAEFQVLPDLPADLAWGLFAAPATYKAWIRFSNGSPRPQADAKGDGRGMAIKLMGVEGSPSTTQDFILINHPVFAVRDVVDYLDLENASPFWRFFLPGFNPLHWRFHEAMIARAILGKKVYNLLNIQYWSMSPYRFADTACKYSVQPAGPQSPFASVDDPDFLRANLIRHLDQSEATFDFMVQLRARPDTMPIEDATIEWDETAAPFVPVARITIPRQAFNSPEQLRFCENLSFTPWHCLDAHRPLGGLNRLRRAVYETVSRVRHELNHAPRREPVDFTIS